MNNKVAPKNSGFSLLEVLISLVIMSVGMMGLAGLKINAINGTNTAHFRHEASLLMANLADRMRANEEAVDNGSYKLSTPINLSTALVPNPDCSSAACTADELAIYDKYQIARKLSLAIPSSTLVISCPADNCKTVDGVKVEHTMTINWKEKKDKSEKIISTVGGVVVTNEFNDHSITLVITP